MNSSLFLLLGLGGRMDPKALHEMIARGNEKRRKIFMKLADLLFGLFMILFGQIKLTGPDGKPLDLSNPSALSADDKLNAILLTQDVTQRGTLFREFLRPAIISIAELLASLMEPDEMLLNLIGNNQAASTAGGGFSAPSVPSGYEGQVIAGPQDKRAWHIQNGQKRWIKSPATLKNVYGDRYVNVSQDVVDAFPIGPEEP